MASVGPIEVPVKFTGDMAGAFKPGWQTSEFWMTTAMHVLTLLLASGALPTGSVWEKIAAFALSAIAQASYNTSRGNTKQAVADAIANLKRAVPPPPSMNALAELLLLSLLALFVGGCGAGPAASYVAADHATFDAVAPEYSNYVIADPALPDADKQRRLNTLGTWRLRVEQAEKNLATTQPAAPLQPIQPLPAPSPPALPATLP